MRAGAWVGVVLLAVAVGSATLAAGDGRRQPSRQSAMVYLVEPTLIGSTIVQGPVLFTHDAGKMARGEPCTSIRFVDPETGPMGEIAAFHCLPRPGTAAHRFIVTSRPNVLDGLGCILTAYQFAGDSEVHGVPVAAMAH
jgi:hypothetical protein